MSLGKKVTLNTGAQIPYVLQLDNDVPPELQWAVQSPGGKLTRQLQPAGLWYLAVRPRSGRRGRLRGSEGRLPPLGMRFDSWPWAHN
jgi:hypothetical protein